MGQIPKVLALLCVVRKGRPPQSKFTITWDVKKVLGFSEKPNNDDSISLKDLVLKLAICIALTSAGGVLEIEFRDTNISSSYIFYIHKNIKTSEQEKPKNSVKVSSI